MKITYKDVNRNEPETLEWVEQIVMAESGFPTNFVKIKVKDKTKNFSFWRVLFVQWFEVSE